MMMEVWLPKFDKPNVLVEKDAGLGAQGEMGSEKICNRYAQGEAGNGDQATTQQEQKSHAQRLRRARGLQDAQLELCLLRLGGPRRNHVALAAFRADPGVAEACAAGATRMDPLVAIPRAETAPDLLAFPGELTLKKALLRMQRTGILRVTKHGLRLTAREWQRLKKLAGQRHSHAQQGAEREESEEEEVVELRELAAAEAARGRGASARGEEAGSRSKGGVRGEGQWDQGGECWGLSAADVRSID